MTKTESCEQRMKIRGWTVAICTIAVWFCLMANSAEAQQFQVPSFVLAQVLGEDAVPAARPVQVVPTTTNLVAHQMLQQFEDQLVAGVSRPSIELEIHFDFDSDQIHTESVAQIQAAAFVLTNHFPNTRFRVAGYTDASGSPDYNQVLSERRAMAVWQQLVDEYGVSPDRIESVGFGEDVADESSDAQRRRVELQILRGEALSL